MARNEVELLSKFVQSFSVDGGQPEFEGEPVTPQMTDSFALEAIYRIIPIRFPALFEKLLLSFRWYGADIGLFRIFPNPPGEDLSFMAESIQL
jgi:hypothetical protein